MPFSVAIKLFDYYSENVSNIKISNFCPQKSILWDLQFINNCIILITLMFELKQLTNNFYEPTFMVKPPHIFMAFSLNLKQAVINL